MKRLIIIAFVAVSFAACTTKETKETSTETVTTPPPTPPTPASSPVPATKPAPANNDPGVDISISDTGSGMRIKVPIKK